MFIYFTGEGTEPCDQFLKVGLKTTFLSIFQVPLEVTGFLYFPHRVV